MTEQFTVIISLHKTDRVDWFHQSVQSILEQSVNPAEMIITIDGELPVEHEEAIKAIRKNYPDISVEEMRWPAVNSRGVVLGEAVKRSTNEMVAIMDADDIAINTRFEERLSAFKSDPQLDVVGSWIEEIRPGTESFAAFREVPVDHQEIAKFAKWRNPINNMTVMFKRSAVIEAGNFVGMPNFADYWLWIRLLHINKRFYNVPKVLVRARAERGMIKRRRGFTYLKSEVAFYRAAYKIGYFTATQALIRICTRPPVRLLPRRLLLEIYHRLLRTADN